MRGEIDVDKLIGLDTEKFTDYVDFLNQIGLEKRLIIAIEEMSELQKEYTKILRGKLRRECLIEEMADVLLTMTCSARMLNISQKELDEAVLSKSQRNGYDLNAKSNT